MTVSNFPRFLFSALALASGVQLSASEPVPAAGEKLTLQAAIAEAISQSPALRVIDASIESARGGVESAGLLPNSELTFAPGLKRVQEGDSSHDEFKGVLEWNRTYLSRDKREVAVAIAERGVELHTLDLDGLRFQLSAAVRKVFIELLVAQNIIDLRQQQLASAQAFQEAATKRAEAGYASDFEAVKAQGEVINARKLLQTASNQIASGRVELNGLLGRDPLAPLEVTGSLDVTISTKPLPDLITEALTHNPVLRLQAMQADIAELNVRRARLIRKSDYTLGPSFEYSKSEQILGLSATIALPSKKYGQGELLTATADQRKILAETDNVRREITSAVARAATQLAGARAQLTLYSPAYLDQLKAVVAQAENSYAQNATSLLIYLDAQRTYFDTLADYHEAIAAVAIARAELESAVGAPLQ